MGLVPSNCFVQKALALPLLSPKARADQADTIDDDEVGIGAWGQLVVQLKRDVIGMVC